MKTRAYIIIRVEVNPHMLGDGMIQMAEEMRSVIEGTFFDQVLKVEGETERHALESNSGGAV